MQGKKFGTSARVLTAAFISTIMAFAMACGGETKIERVVETVVVEKIVEKVVDRAVEVEKIVEKEVPVEVVKEVIVEKIVEKIQTELLVATPTPAPESDDAGIKDRTIVVGVLAVPAPKFLNSSLNYPDGGKHNRWGFSESPIRYDYNADASWQFGPVIPWLAETWEVASDLSNVTFGVRKGVKFTNGYDMTAQDWVHSFGTGPAGVLANGSKYERVGEISVYNHEWSAPDPYTAIMHVNVPENFSMADDDSTSWRGLWAQGAAPGVFSKQLYDELGHEGALTSLVSTGPWKALSWKANDAVFAEANENYWGPTGTSSALGVVPRTRYLRIIEVPEAATREAAFKTGEIHITSLPLGVVKQSVDAVEGGYVVRITGGRGQLVVFGGNYDIKNPHDPDNVTASESYPRSGLDPTKPWIGDPDDEDSLQQARTVRHALAQAIDRDLLIESSLDGYGSLLYTMVQIHPGMDEYKSDWDIPFDPDNAKKLLAEAGYPDCFDLPWWIAPDSALVNPEVGMAIAQMWTNMGCKVEIDNTAYAAQRPSLVDRSFKKPWLMHGGQGDKKYNCAGLAVLATRGFSYGMEIQRISDNYLNCRGEKDNSKLLAMNIALQDYLTEEMFWAPTVMMHELFAVSGEVKSWQAAHQGGNIPGYFNTIVMR